MSSSLMDENQILGKTPINLLNAAIGLADHQRLANAVATFWQQKNP